jgi:acyl carrier protein
MTPVSEAQVRQFIVERYSTALSSNGVLATAIADDYDLLQEGVIDSLGLLEMISAVETAFGIKLDFEALDAESLTQVGPFCRCVAAQRKDDAGDAVRATV